MRVFVLNFHRGTGLIKGISLVVCILMLAVACIYTVNLVFNEQYVAASGIGESSGVIIIDAGHGGEDPGAEGEGGILEKDLNLAIAKLLGEELSAKGYTVVYTRTEDKMLYSEEENIKGMRKLSDLKNRCKIAEGYPDALMISIHMNSYGASKYSGLQVYYSRENQNSYMLADSIQSSVKGNLQPENERKIKEGKGLYLLEHSPVSSVIVECGFLTNSEELKKLSEKEYQKQLSFAISCGIINYIEKVGVSQE